MTQGTVVEIERKKHDVRFPLIRKFTRWILRGLFVIFALLFLAATSGLVYEQVSQASDSRRLAPRGRLIDIGTHHMHLDCTGQGSPTIILDAGAVLWSSSWLWIQQDLSHTTRVCSYDRTGTGWSDPGPSVQTLEGIQAMDGVRAAKELHLLLEKAGEHGPYVYVGHSLGGMLARIYYQKYPQDLAGMVLIEPGDPEILLTNSPSLRKTQLRVCGRVCTIAELASRLGIIRLWLRRNPIINDARLNPDSVADFKVRIVLPHVINTNAALGKILGNICRETQENRSLGDLPLAIIHGTEFVPPYFQTDSEAEHREAVKQVMDRWEAMTKLSSKRSPLVEIKGANHLTIIAYKEHAMQVSNTISTMIKNQRAGE